MGVGAARRGPFWNQMGIGFAGRSHFGAPARPPGDGPHPAGPNSRRFIVPRIPGVPTRSAGLLGRLLYRYARRRYGAVPEPATVLLHHPSVLLAYSTWELGNEKAMRRLPTALRELAVHRVATQVGCSWCVDFGTMLARRQGLDLQRLHAIDDYAGSAVFSELERRVLAYADAMTALPTTVTDEMVADLDAELGHRGLVELTYAIAVENHRARFNHALDITDQGFTSGEACRVPVPADAAPTPSRLMET